MLFVISFVALCLIGIVDAGYLTYRHFNKEKAFVCPLGSDCSAVTESKWGNFLGIRNEVLGLLFYVGALCAIAVSFIFPDWASTIYFLILLASGGGLLYSIFLTLVQIFSLKNYCFYCLVSATINLLLFANIVLLYYR